MGKTFPLPIVLSVVLYAGLGSGCAIHELRNVNRRLKGANDRLVSENNRLEQELFTTFEGTPTDDILDSHDKDTVMCRMNTVTVQIMEPTTKYEVLYSIVPE